MAVLVRWQCAGFMKIETNCNVLERQCSMTAQGLMDSLPGKPFYVCIESFRAKLVNRPKFMIVAPSSNSRHASYTRNMMSCICWKMKDWLVCKVTNLIPILMLMMFAVSSWAQLQRSGPSQRCESIRLNFKDRLARWANPSHLIFCLSTQVC